MITCEKNCRLWNHVLLRCDDTTEYIRRGTNDLCCRYHPDAVPKEDSSDQMTITERAFVMMSESILVNLTEPEQRVRLAGELREYWLRKAEEEIK